LPSQPFDNKLWWQFCCLIVNFIQIYHKYLECTTRDY